MEVRHGAKKREKKSKRKAKTVEGSLFSSGTVSVETRRGHSVSGSRARKILENLLCLPACLPADDQIPTLVCGTLVSL